MRFSGIDQSMYSLLVSQLALHCGIQYFFGGSTCPAGRALPPTAAAAACTGNAPWPPVVGSAQASGGSGSDDGVVGGPIPWRQDVCLAASSDSDGGGGQDAGSGGSAGD